MGILLVAPTLAIHLKPKVPIANIFGMIEYAYRLRSLEIGRGIARVSSVQEAFEALAVVLARRTLQRLSRGLYASYRERAERSAAVRGRIDALAAITTPWNPNLRCTFEEHTADVAENQIIAWALSRIIRSRVCSARGLPTVRAAFQGIAGRASLRPWEPRDCSGRLYNRLNADYEVLHGLCRLFLEHSGPGLQVGDSVMPPFLVNMSRLFELFVAEWLAAHLPPELELRYQEQVTVGGGGLYSFQVDAVIYKRQTRTPVMVLDAKYKTASKAEPEDLYQVVAYAETLGCHRDGAGVSRRAPRARGGDVREKPRVYPPL